MYQHLVTNECGEPMYVKNVPDAQEEQEMYWEEMQHRSEDPLYAESCERNMWFHRACDIFAENGVEVPDYVISAFAKELRIKQREDEANKAIEEAKPSLDFLNKHFPNMFKTYYEYPTPDTYGYAYIEYVGKIEDAPYRDEIESVINLALEQNIYIEDFLCCWDCFKKRDITK